jgi:CDP-diacylglycerol--serine O-phosphatidyltransferase
MKENPKKFVPAGASLGNLGAGVLACALAIEGRPEIAALLVIAAVVLDSADGALARKFGVSSDFGVQLDSLADVISFGVAPAVLVGTLVMARFQFVGWGIMVIFPVCGAWRLARYNVDDASSSDADAEFCGLPTTGAGGAVATAVLVHLLLMKSGFAVGLNLLPPAVLFLAFLMVSHFPYRHTGALMGEMPRGLAVGWVALLALAGIMWHYEVVLAVLFWAYILSGPATSAREKLVAIHRARP